VVNATQVVGGTSQQVQHRGTVTINGVTTTSFTASATDLEQPDEHDQRDQHDRGQKRQSSDNGKTITLTAADGRNVAVDVSCELRSGGWPRHDYCGHRYGRREVTASTINLSSAGSFVAAGSGGTPASATEASNSARSVVPPASS
jgi:hypothetical protein